MLMAPEQNPYACLGLPPASSLPEIKRQYRQLAKQCHPDANGSAGAEDKLRALNAAYEFLSDPLRKSAYDIAFEARNTPFNPARVLQPMPRVYRRRDPLLRVVAGFTLLLLLFAGIGFLLSAENAGPALTGLYSQLSGKTAGSGRPLPGYTFLPSHGAFDDNSGTAAPAPAPDTPVSTAPVQASLP